jgi:hypothetical protein
MTMAGSAVLPPDSNTSSAPERQFDDDQVDLGIDGTMQVRGAVTHRRDAKPRS